MVGVRRGLEGESSLIAFCALTNKWCVVCHQWLISPTAIFILTCEGSCREPLCWCDWVRGWRGRWPTGSITSSSVWIWSSYRQQSLRVTLSFPGFGPELWLNHMTYRTLSVTCLFVSGTGKRSLWEGGWGHRNRSHHAGGEDECLQDWPIWSQQSGTCRGLQLGKTSVELEKWTFQVQTDNLMSSLTEIGTVKTDPSPCYWHEFTLYKIIVLIWTKWYNAQFL